MKIINLRKYYPQYQSDYLIEVADEIAFCIEDLERREHAYQIRRYRYKAYYSLDRCDGIEKDILFVSLSPHEIFERILTRQELHAAISHLPDKQAKRIYAHFFLGMSKRDIAKAEGVSEEATYQAIQRGFRNIEIFLKRCR